MKKTLIDFYLAGERICSIDKDDHTKESIEDLRSELASLNDVPADFVMTFERNVTDEQIAEQAVGVLLSDVGIGTL